LLGTWELRAIDQSGVDGVLWLELREDGSARFASCLNGQLKRSSGTYLYDRRTLEVREGDKRRGGRVVAIDGGWQWIGEYLGPQAASGTFRRGALPEACASR
jgi:hypothetical protein